MVRTRETTLGSPHALAQGTACPLVVPILLALLSRARYLLRVAMPSAVALKWEDPSREKVRWKQEILPEDLVPPQPIGSHVMRPLGALLRAWEPCTGQAVILLAERSFFPNASLKRSSVEPALCSCEATLARCKPLGSQETSWGDPEAVVARELLTPGSDEKEPGAYSSVASHERWLSKPSRVGGKTRSGLKLPWRQERARGSREVSRGDGPRRSEWLKAWWHPGVEHESSSDDGLEGTRPWLLQQREAARLQEEEALACELVEKVKAKAESRARVEGQPREEGLALEEVARAPIEQERKHYTLKQEVARLRAELPGRPRDLTIHDLRLGIPPWRPSGSRCSH